MEGPQCSYEPPSNSFIRSTKDTIAQTSNDPKHSAERIMKVGNNSARCSCDSHNLNGLIIPTSRASFAMSTSSQPQFTTEQIRKIRAKFPRFRVLVIGRANAGKTTILQRLCNTTEEPTIFSPNGEKVGHIVKFYARYRTFIAHNLRLSHRPLIHPWR